MTIIILIVSLMTIWVGLPITVIALLLGWRIRESRKRKQKRHHKRKVTTEIPTESIKVFGTIILAKCGKKYVVITQCDQSNPKKDCRVKMAKDVKGFAEKLAGIYNSMPEDIEKEVAKIYFESKGGK